MSIIIFILILAVLVLVHEFGHFIAAKRNGVLVEEFGFGFPPRLFGVRKGETLYSVNLIPLGGFVKLYGEEYVEEDVQKDKNLPHKNRAFIGKKPPVKALIILAGVLMNILLASAIYYVLLGTNGFKSDPVVMIGDHTFAFGKGESQIVVAGASKDSVAARAGITSGDVITRFKVEGDNTFKTITAPDMLIKEINKASGKKVAIEFVNIKNGVKKTATVVPAYNKELERAVIGIGLAQVTTISYLRPQEKIFAGFMHSYNMASYSLSAFGQIISESFKSKDLGLVGEAVSGPVGIFYAVSETVKDSGARLVRNLLDITALLSISLAVMNVLPFPALDGGKMVFVFYEWVTRRNVNKYVEQYINLAGIVTLLFLALVISVNDIIKLWRP